VLSCWHGPSLRPATNVGITDSNAVIASSETRRQLVFRHALKMPFRDCCNELAASLWRLPDIRLVSIFGGRSRRAAMAGNRLLNPAF
jgi:hypothetical protein